MHFQNKAASLYVNISTDKNVMGTFMVLYFNLKFYLYNQSRIFKIEVMELILRLINLVYFLTQPVLLLKKTRHGVVND